MYTWIDYVSIMSNVLLVIGAFSAFLIYFMQKRSEKKMAATLIVGQINSIDKQISQIKMDSNLNDTSVFKMKPILEDNMWEKYKHLFVKDLSNTEYQLVQIYFEQAEFLERRRIDIVNTIYSAWKDKSSVEHQIVGKTIFDNISKNTDDQGVIEVFRQSFRGKDLLFLPDIAIVTLLSGLQNFDLLSGKTAYAKLNKKAYLR